MRVDPLDGGNANAYLQVLIHMYIMYIFVCKYVCIAVVCLFGVGSYGLASTEAGATPASLVVISPHLEMYFWTTRCSCTSRPLEEKVQLHLASAGPEMPEEGDSQAGVDRPRGGSRTPRRRKNRPKKPRACGSFFRHSFGPALKSAHQLGARLAVRAATIAPP